MAGSGGQVIYFRCFPRTTLKICLRQIELRVEGCKLESGVVETAHTWERQGKGGTGDTYRLQWGGTLMALSEATRCWLVRSVYMGGFTPLFAMSLA